MLKIEPGREPAVPRHAATVVLLRDTSDGFEVFMVRRHQKSGFMGGAFVFPGGKLDDADRDPRVLARLEGRTLAEAAEALGEPDDDARAAALFVAAIRETFEEAGVLLARTREDADLAAARADLQAGAPLADVLEQVDAGLWLDRLVPWTRWVTPAVEPRRYDARFFLAIAPRGQRAAHDERETTAAAWLTPRDALERGRRGEIQLPPPTLRTLEMLAAFERTRDVVADAASRPPPLIDPVFRDEDGRWVLALPGDVGHPDAEARVPGPTRFVLADGRWWSGEPETR
jgi:8-oxo-dGTP pyrophosphatase MutT (NUDIX family)